MSVFAAIDLGANSIRMTIAQKVNGNLETLEKMEYPLRLGKETFLKRHLTSEALQETIKILELFRSKFDEYDITRYRAVATSAIRVIENQDFFLEQVRLKTGFNIEIIEKSEEEKLVYMGLVENIPDFKKLAKAGVVFTKVGSGNVEVSMLKVDEIFFSRSIPIGGLRLRQALHDVSEEYFQEAMEKYVHSDIKMLEQSMPKNPVKHFIGSGTLLRIIYKIIGSDNVITYSAITKFYKELRNKTIWQIAEHYDLPSEHADLLLPSTYVYLRFLELTGIQQITFVDMSFTECLINHLAGMFKSKFMTKQLWKSAIGIGDKYHFDKKHAMQVTKIAMKIFDALKPIHNLSIKHRFILKLAALWHDIGIFIRNSEHHKHSYYLISNIEMPGLSTPDIQLIATIARYHRRSMPKKYHVEYTSLRDRDRVVVTKLAAILRIADALDRGHSQSLDNIRIDLKGNTAVFHVSFKKTGWLEIMHFEAKRDLFDRVFGIDVEVVEGIE